MQLLLTKYDGFDMWSTNPDMIVVDSEVIAKALVRFFVADMGDALATYPEAAACFAKRAVACTGSVQTITAMSMAKLCFDTILEFGVFAKSAVELKVVTPAVEKVIEANILLSGVGWESGKGDKRKRTGRNSLFLLRQDLQDYR